MYITKLSLPCELNQILSNLLVNKNFLLELCLKEGIFFEYSFPDLLKFEDAFLEFSNALP